MNPFSSPSSSFPSHHHHHRSPAFIPHPPGTGNGGNANPPSGSWLESRYNPGDDRLSPRSAEEEPEEAGVLPVLGTSRTHGPVAEIEKEHMFDKVVTPSDVGKLNRLVIPKQHAERYFPLDSSSNEKGLLLNFEDRTGKPWRFRYSYWNSSQSYVITKGWSRFVKEKKLDAGNIVSFQRGVGEAGKDRLFIDWRRHPGHCHRSTVTPHPFLIPHGMDHHHNGYMGGSRVNYGYGNVVCGEGSLFYLSRSSLAPSLPLQVGVREVRGGSGRAELPIPVVFNSVPVVQGKAAAKRLRLFGVNMDCPISESTDEHRQGCEILSSTSISHATAIRSQPPPTIYHQLQPILAPSPPSQSPHLQLELYNGMPLISKGKASSSMSLDGQLR